MIKAQRERLLRLGIKVNYDGVITRIDYLEKYTYIFRIYCYTMAYIYLIYLYYYLLRSHDRIFYYKWLLLGESYYSDIVAHYLKASCFRALNHRDIRVYEVEGELHHFESPYRYSPEAVQFRKLEEAEIKTLSVWFDIETRKMKTAEEKLIKITRNGKLIPRRNEKKLPMVFSIKYNFGHYYLSTSEGMMIVEKIINTDTGKLLPGDQIVAATERNPIDLYRVEVDSSISVINPNIIHSEFYQLRNPRKTLHNGIITLHPYHFPPVNDPAYVLALIAGLL